MVARKLSIVCPQEPHRKIVKSEHPGPLCPVCKKILGSKDNECRANIKILKAPLLEDLGQTGNQVILRGVYKLRK